MACCCMIQCGRVRAFWGMQSVEGARKLLQQGARGVVRVGASQARCSHISANVCKTTARRLVRDRPAAVAGFSNFSRPEDERWTRPAGLGTRPYPPHPTRSPDSALAATSPDPHITSKQDIVYPRGLTRPNHRALNSLIRDVAKMGNVEALLQCVRKQERGGGRADALDFCPVNCANWLNKWSKLPYKYLVGTAPPEVTQVLGRALYLLERDPIIFQAREVSNMACAVAKLRHDALPDQTEPLHVSVLKGLLRWPLRHGWVKWLPMHVAGLLSAVHHGKARVEDEWLQAVVAQCEELGLERFKCQEMGVLAHTLGGLRYQGARGLLTGVAQRCVAEGLEGFTPQGLANLLCGYVNMPLAPGDALLDAVALEVDKRGEEAFEPFAARRLVILLTKLDRDPGEMLRRVAAKSIKPLKERAKRNEGAGAGAGESGV